MDRRGCCCCCSDQRKVRIGWEESLGSHGEARTFTHKLSRHVKITHNAVFLPSAGGFTGGLNPPESSVDLDFLSSPFSVTLRSYIHHMDFYLDHTRSSLPSRAARSEVPPAGVEDQNRPPGRVQYYIALLTFCSVVLLLRLGSKLNKVYNFNNR